MAEAAQIRYDVTGSRPRLRANLITTLLRLFLSIDEVGAARHYLQQSL